MPDSSKPVSKPPAVSQAVITQELPEHFTTLAQNAFAFCLFLMILCLAMLGSLVIVHRMFRRWHSARRGTELDALVSTDSLRAGQDVLVEIEGGRSGRWRGKAQIEAVQKQVMCLATRPQEDLSATGNRIVKGAPLQVMVASGSVAFQFHACLQDWRTTDDTLTLFIDRPLWMAKIQRREYFRISVREPTMVSTIGGRPEASRRLRTVLENVSAGGCSLVLAEPLEAGTCVRLRMPSGSLGGFSFEARVLRCLSRPLSGDMPYLAHCEFLPFSEDTRSLLVSYCFEKERAQQVERRR